MENLIKKAIKIRGMTCSSCEIRIENAIKSLEGIVEIKASFSDSYVRVTYDGEIIGLDEICDAIEKLDYQVEKDKLKKNANKENFSSDKLNINQLIAIGIIIFSLYIIVKHTIGFNFIPEINESMGYGILFIVGVLTSLHCIAMCGGINLSQCVSHGNNKCNKKLSSLKPSILYNAGRVISYTVIGGIVGGVGSVLSFSGTAQGTVAIFAGVFMVIMGLNMLNIFPWLRKFNIRMPKSIGNKIFNNKSKRGPLYIGLLNGFMPCGPLQTMQLYALGTGSFVRGALSMFLFSIGTVPLMFGFGAISSLLSSKFTHKMMRVSALLVMILGVVMVSRGLSLSGISFATGASGNVALVGDDIQVVTTQMRSGSYTPIVVQKGIPVRWIINAETSDLNGCNNPVTIPAYNIRKRLEPGENIIEFFPEEEGNLVYTCWMGMISSNIRVVEDIRSVSDADIDNRDGLLGENLIPLNEVAVGEIKGDLQYVKIEVGEFEFSPAIVVLQRGIETKWELIVDEANYCNSIIVFPEYNARIRLDYGVNEITFIPEGDFSFSCWMGMIHGYVKVVEDTNNINIDIIKDEVRSFIPPQSTQRGFGGGSGGPSCH
ncbi:UNVERIFIED_CONTAM: sulfite exporter TauE/SafE [Acetivibrio alkalicellulosi]